jgi:hypothetical protein
MARRASNERLESMIGRAVRDLRLFERDQIPREIIINHSKGSIFTCR